MQQQQPSHGRSSRIPVPVMTGCCTGLCSGGPPPEPVVELPPPRMTIQIPARASNREPVRNMGNFNFLIHVPTIFHHVEQCCYPSFPIISHIPSHDISRCLCHLRSNHAHHDTRTFVTLQFLLRLSLFLCIWGHTFLMFLTFFPILSYPCRLTHSVQIRNQVYLSTCNCSRLIAILEGFLKTT